MHGGVGLVRVLVFRLVPLAGRDGGPGRHVHERPGSGSKATISDTLDPGVVVTIEPGLYYPEKGIGVRLEDTVHIRQDGSPEILAEYPLDLVLPMR